MTTTIWKQFFLMWEERNLLVHGHNTKTRTIATRRRLATEFRYLHTKRNEVLATDHDLFIGDNDDDVATFIDTVSPKYIEIGSKSGARSSSTTPKLPRLSPLHQLNP
jgi:hypothetical protein